MSQLQILLEGKQSGIIDMNISENYDSSEESNSNNLKEYESTMLRVKSLLTSLPENTLGNGAGSLEDWQITILSVTESDYGIKCLLNMWFGLSESDTKNETNCGTVWDNINCWPATLGGTIIRRSCMQVLEKVPEISGRQVDGYAYRHCLSNGTWSRGIRTNYSECAKALLQLPNTLNEEHLSVFAQYMVFFGSIASLTCLGIALVVLCCFRNVWNERIKIHVHLMLSLVLRFVVFVVVSEPLVSKRTSSYRDDSILCKIVLMTHLYATVASTSWMLVQGIYLNGKLTTNVFGFGKYGFLKFYILGWGLPLLLLGIYLTAMIATNHSGNCWQGYADMTEIWILLVPMEAEMLLTGLLLCNILRIVIKNRRNTNEESEFTRIKYFLQQVYMLPLSVLLLRSIAKCTLVLFPILGINNLLFLYNPGGEYETLYVSLNISFCSTQGVLVAIVYCFNSTEVHTAISRSYNRYSIRRSVYNASSDNGNALAMVVIRIDDMARPNFYNSNGGNEVEELG